MKRLLGLAAAAVMAVAGITGTAATPQAHCQVNVGTCSTGGHCTVNVGYCANDGNCTITVGRCDGGDTDLLAL